MASKKKTDDRIDVISIRKEHVTFCVIGKTPLINHRLSEKARMELLLPAKRKNVAERQSTAKHDPIAEFRSSPYTLTEGPTLLALLGTAFKGALKSVALDMPGATKAQLGRLTAIEENRVPVYGVPKLHMTPVRNSGMNRTPDIRTRAIVENWAAYVTVSYAVPMLDMRTVSMLFSAAGEIVGVGDWRPEKGSGNFGTFEVVDDDDERFLEIIKTGGREAQEAAMLRAEPYDAESEELLAWFLEEADRRELAVAK